MSVTCLSLLNFDMVRLVSTGNHIRKQGVSMSTCLWVLITEMIMRISRIFWAWLNWNESVAWQHPVYSDVFALFRDQFQFHLIEKYFCFYKHLSPPCWLENCSCHLISTQRNLDQNGTLVRLLQSVKKKRKVGACCLQAVTFKLSYTKMLHLYFQLHFSPNYHYYCERNAVESTGAAFSRKKSQDYLLSFLR